MDCLGPDENQNSRTTPVRLVRAVPHTRTAHFVATPVRSTLMDSLWLLLRSVRHLLPYRAVLVLAVRHNLWYPNDLRGTRCCGLACGRQPLLTVLNLQGVASAWRWIRFSASAARLWRARGSG